LKKNKKNSFPFKTNVLVISSDWKSVLSLG